MNRHRADTLITGGPISGRKIITRAMIAVMMALVLAGCGGSSSEPATKNVVVDITLSGSSVQPNGDKVNINKGQTVVLKVSSDHDDQVHVHGDYDVELHVLSGKDASTSFVADQVGSFEVESHHPPKIIAILNIR